MKTHLSSAADALDLFQSFYDDELISQETLHECTDWFEKLYDAIGSGIDNELVRNETYWAGIRREWGFASASKFTPINASNLCPEPTAVVHSINRFRIDLNNNVALQRRTAPGGTPGYFVQKFDEARAEIAEVLNCCDQDLAIIRNASEGNNLIGSGIKDWQGTTSALAEVVLWRDNHPTNLEAWKMRSEWNGGKLFEIKYVDHRPEGDPEVVRTPEQLVKNITEAFTNNINAQTRIVTFNETSAINGMRIPPEAIRNIYRYIEEKHPNCHLHVDGAQTWGAQRVDLTSDRYCHSFSASAHKWFCGPKETGILWMDPRKVMNFQPSVYAYDYAIRVPKTWNDLPKNTRRFEYLGQRDDANILALHCTQRLMNRINARDPDGDLVGKRTAYLAGKLIEKIGNDWKFVSPHREDQRLIRHGVVRVQAPQSLTRTGMSLYNYLYARKGIAGAGGDIDKVETMRLSPHIYNLVDDLQSAVDGMKDWRR